MKHRGQPPNSKSKANPKYSTYIDSGQFQSLRCHVHFRSQQAHLQSREALSGSFFSFGQLDTRISLKHGKGRASQYMLFKSGRCSK
ncbi:hypothetical protein QQP08_019335 [Theobroma cacao]|nr:hypothetical protein QQP08_019335 [Theobroma cacao]